MNNGADYAYVAFLDVLGYRHELERDRINGTMAFKDKLQDALSSLSAINQSIYAYQAISDTIILSSSNRDGLVSFLEVVKGLLLSFLSKRILVRGGISYQQHFKSANVTYSHALARAYELESSVAVYPRVVLDGNIIEMFVSAGEAKPLVDSGLICERNGIFFLNFIDNVNWLDVYNWSKIIYDECKHVIAGSEREFIKHAWLEDYIMTSKFAVPQRGRYINGIKMMEELSTCRVKSCQVSRFSDASSNSASDSSVNSARKFTFADSIAADSLAMILPRLLLSTKR